MVGTFSEPSTSIFRSMCGHLDLSDCSHSSKLPWTLGDKVTASGISRIPSLNAFLEEFGDVLSCCGGRTLETVMNLAGGRVKSCTEGEKIPHPRWKG